MPTALPPVVDTSHTVKVNIDPIPANLPVPIAVPQSTVNPAPSAQNVTAVATEVLQAPPQPTSCCQKITNAYEVVKNKIITWLRSFDDWTNNTFPPTVAKCVQIFARYLPFAIALLFIPSTIVFGLFALAVVVRLICPEISTNNPKLHGFFAAAARVMGVFCSIMGVYSAVTMSFSQTPHVSLIAMAVNLAIAGICFYVAENEWTPKPNPHIPNHQHVTTNKLTQKSASRPATPLIPLQQSLEMPSVSQLSLNTSSSPTNVVPPSPKLLSAQPPNTAIAAIAQQASGMISPKPPLHPLSRSSTPTNKSLVPPLPPIPTASLALRNNSGFTKPIVKGGVSSTLTQPLSGVSGSLGRRTLPSTLTISVSNNSAGTPTVLDMSPVPVNTTADGVNGSASV